MHEALLMGILVSYLNPFAYRLTDCVLNIAMSRTLNALPRGLSWIVLAALAFAICVPLYRTLLLRAQAPAVSYTLLSGEQGTLQQWKGQVVLVNFWATSCSSCIKEMPELVKLQNTWGAKGYRTLAVAMSYDNPDFVAQYTASRQLPFMVTHDAQGTIATAFGSVQATPTTFLVDREGRIVKRYLGPPDFNKLDRALAALLHKTDDSPV
jgi:peroxiredoxin